jgi:hypothetical protein
MLLICSAFLMLGCTEKQIIMIGSDFNDINYLTKVDANGFYPLKADVNIWINQKLVPYLTKVDANGFYPLKADVLDINVFYKCTDSQVLVADGSCQQINGLSSFYYPTDIPSDIAGYDFLHDYPDYNSDSDTAIVSSGTGRVLIDSYITDKNNPYVSVVPAGIYSFFVYASISSDAGETYIDINVMKRDLAGNEFNFFGVTTPVIDGAISKLYRVDYALLADADVNLTDRFIVKFYGRNNHALDKNLVLYYGGMNAYTYIRTTLPAGGSSGYVRYIGNSNNLYMGDYNIYANNLYTKLDVNASFLSKVDANGFYALKTDINKTPVNTPLVSKNWFNSYNSTTGVFGASQIYFTDLNITPAITCPAGTYMYGLLTGGVYCSTPPDTNWQTSWGTLDTNLRATYALIGSAGGTDTNWVTSWNTFDTNLAGTYRLYTTDLNTTGKIQADKNFLIGPKGYMYDDGNSIVIGRVA